MAVYDVAVEKQKKSRNCLCNIPWAAFLAAGLFIAGLALFIGGATKIGDYTVQAANAIGVAPSLTSALKSGLLTAILAISICGFVIIALVVLLALWKFAFTSMLWGQCCCTDKPEPWLFTAYRAFCGLLKLLMWLLVLAVVVMLMFVLLWLGGAVAVNTAITRGTNQADNLLSPLGITLSEASDASAAAMAFLTPLVSSPAAAQQLMGSGSNYAFQPLCPPVCLNLGSFAMFMQSDSCICGSAKLSAVQGAAREGTRVAIIALAGSFAMYVASTALLMVLTSHYVEAKFDRWTAKKLKQKQAEEYENGYMADPEDCVVEQQQQPASQVQSGTMMNPFVAPVQANLPYTLPSIRPL